jgi:hypothetical protein
MQQQQIKNTMAGQNKNKKLSTFTPEKETNKILNGCPVKTRIDCIGTLSRQSMQQQYHALEGSLGELSRSKKHGGIFESFLQNVPLDK